MSLYHTHLKSFSRIGEQIRKDLLFKPLPVVEAIRDIVERLFDMVLVYIVCRKKHHIKRLGRLCCSIVDELQHVHIGPVVTVEDTDVFP